MSVLVVVIGLAIVATTLVAAYQAFRTPVRRRWFWAVIALLCAPTVYFRPRTGELALELLSVQFFGFGWSSADDGSTWFALALPLGALAFFQRRRSLLARQFPAMADDQLDRL